MIVSYVYKRDNIREGTIIHGIAQLTEQHNGISFYVDISNITSDAVTNYCKQLAITYLANQQLIKRTEWSTLSTKEKQQLVHKALQLTNGNRTKASQLLYINRKTLTRYITLPYYEYFS